MQDICHLNGQILPLDQAQVPVLDRGFIFGDGIYEVVPVYQGVPFRAAQHHRRLARSLAEVRIDPPFDEAGFTALMRDLLDHPATPRIDRQMIYLQITRGVAPRNHVIPTGLRPTVFALVQAMPAPAQHDLSAGVSCISSDEFRWLKGHIKSTSLLGSVLARDLSHRVGATETILHRDGWLTEGSATNVWVVQGGVVLGVPKDAGVLEGIRYGLIEELCASQGIPFQLRPVAWSEVLAADELMISSASKEVLPVTTLDGAQVGIGQPGPVWQRLYAAYQTAIADTVAKHP
ncbi:MAG: aminotransferase class IV [Alphaproteobacteria bacterium]|nr:aminotransferase class IV [Alphaproteobacteria bacterium]